MIHTILATILAIWSYFVHLAKQVWETVSQALGGGRRVITFDDGRKVQIIRQIAEGGYSFVYSARLSSSSSDTSPPYALKRVLCPDDDTIRKCREEIRVHRLFNHDNLMPLLAYKFETGGEKDYKGTVCYMLFPLLPSSLRDQISDRQLLSSDAPLGVRPWKEREVLEIFSSIVHAVQTMHEGGYTHRDIKLENVLMDDRNRPVLMDFGSAGPVDIPIKTRSALLAAVDDAASNSTISYRAPELFEGGARYGENEPAINGKVDVWALGCVLFGMMYGASPFECEFRGECVRIVECSYLRVLGRVPVPPTHTEVATRYSPHLFDCVIWMLNQDRSQRPTIEEVASKIDELLVVCGGRPAKRGGTGSREGFDGITSSNVDANIV